MSRGLSKWQRAILADLEAQPEGVILAYIPDPDTGDVPKGFPVAGHPRAGVALTGACGGALNRRAADIEPRTSAIRS